MKCLKLVMVLGTLAMATQSFARGGGNCSLGNGQAGVLIVIQEQIVQCSTPTNCVVIQPEIVQCVPRPHGH